MASLTPFAVVRDGQFVLAVGSSLAEALESAAGCFYSGSVPADLVVLDSAVEEPPPLAAMPCSEALLASFSDTLGSGPVTISNGLLCLVGEDRAPAEDQLSLF